MTEIVISGVEKLLLERNGFENVISFCLLLSYGKIQNLENENRKTVDRVTIPIKEELQKLEEIKTDKIRIWYSSQDSEDTCTLYFLVSRLYEKDIEISICDTADAQHYSLTSHSDKDIKNIMSRTRVLDIEEKKKYKSIWENLILENGDLRIIENKMIKSVPFSYLDAIILDILKKYDQMRYWSLIGELISLKPNGLYSDIFFIDRIEEMIKQQKIEVCDIKKEKNLINELTEQKYIRIKN